MRQRQKSLLAKRKENFYICINKVRISTDILFDSVSRKFTKLQIKPLTKVQNFVQYEYIRESYVE
jgi:hypothetical protein